MSTAQQKEMDIIDALPHEIQNYIVAFIPTRSIAAMDGMLTHMRTKYFKDGELSIQPDENYEYIDTEHCISVWHTKRYRKITRSSQKFVHLRSIDKTFELLDDFNRRMRALCNHVESCYQEEEWVEFYEHVFMDKWYDEVYAIHIPI